MYHWHHAQTHTWSLRLIRSRLVSDRSIDWEIDPDSLANGVTVNFTSGTLRGHHSETVTFSITTTAG